MSRLEINNLGCQLRYFGFAAIMLLVCLSSAEAGETQRDLRQLYRTKFADYYALKKYEAAAEVYQKHLRDHATDLEAKDLNLLYKYCDCLWQMSLKGPEKLLRKAEAELAAVVNEHPQFVAVRVLYASALAKQKRSEAKEQLLIAAKAGVPVLREIQSPQAKYFRYLLAQPKFIVAVVHAMSSCDAPIRRNFFVEPYNSHPEKIVNTCFRRVRKPGKIKEKIEALFREIEEGIRSSTYKGLLNKFKELNGLINAYKNFAVSDEMKEQVKQCEARYKEEALTRVRIALWLQDAISQGNCVLREMRGFLKREEYQQVFNRFEIACVIVDQLRAVDRPECQRKADQLFFHASNINNTAVKLKRIEEFELRVSGVVLAPEVEINRGLRGNKAVINDRVYHEGQIIIDESGELIAGLVVQRIIKGAVRFRFEDTTFVRSLEPHTETNAQRR